MATYVELIISDFPGFDPALTKSVSIKGQLDESNVDEQAKKIYQILDNLQTNFTLILNFAELEYMNSKAIGYLTDWYTRLSDKQGKILIVQPRENILDILQVVGLTQLIQTYSTIDEARLALNQGGQPAAASNVGQPTAPASTPTTVTAISDAPSAASQIPQQTQPPIQSQIAPSAAPANDSQAVQGSTPMENTVNPVTQPLNMQPLQNSQQEQSPAAAQPSGTPIESSPTTSSSPSATTITSGPSPIETPPPQA